MQRAPEHAWLRDHARAPPEVAAIQRLEGRPPRLLFGPAWRSDLLRGALFPLLAPIGVVARAAGRVFRRVADGVTTVRLAA